ncbi:hypothetical protein EVAR_82678_1 [Eumeta japonica]|uniref:Uncharacterized protein n=1 Tax=Eumeta variegata TaxID=151549 RepID=A0A4C1VAQ7_EUMVA|nr:hypothetical protein EVAR_82678_1 [Eumeta japonica]
MNTVIIGLRSYMVYSRGQCEVASKLEAHYYAQPVRSASACSIDVIPRGSPHHSPGRTIIAGAPKSGSFRGIHEHDTARLTVDMRRAELPTTQAYKPFAISR